MLCSVFTPLTVISSFGTGGSGWLSYDFVGARSWSKANQGGLDTSVSRISWFWPLPRAVTVKPLPATESSLESVHETLTFRLFTLIQNTLPNQLAKWCLNPDPSLGQMSTVPTGAISVSLFLFSLRPACSLHLETLHS